MRRFFDRSDRLRASVTTAAWVLGVFMAAVSATGSTWYVTADPENPEDRIGQVVGQASSGDTVLVGPGTYFEHVPVSQTNLTIIGEAGCMETILDGSRSIPGREGSLVYASISDPANLRLLGMTFQNGTGTQFEGGLVGGAVMIGNARLLEIENCRFVDNTTSPDPNSLGGGAVFAQALDSVSIRNCEFAGNRSRYWGGCAAIYSSSVSQVEITGSHFDIEPTADMGGAALALFMGGLWRIDDNTFLSRGTGVSAIYTNATDVIVRNNTFVDQSGRLATNLAFTYYGVGGVLQTVTFQGNLVIGDEPAGEEGTGFWTALPWGLVRMEGNTFVRCLVRLSQGGPEQALCARNIFYEGPASVYASGSGVVRCNVNWPDTLEASGRDMEVVDNRVADPLFCTEGSPAYQIAVQSPCAAENSPAGCGLIGALGVGCTQSPTERTTWGRIKHMYR